MTSISDTSTRDLEDIVRQQQSELESLRNEALRERRQARHRIHKFCDGNSAAVYCARPRRHGR